MKKKIAGLEIPLFIMLPWAGFIAALFDLKSKRNAFVYIVFAMICGYAISFSDISADSYRYAQAFDRFDNSLNYDTIVKLYREGELRDMYRLLLFYFTSIFSNNPKVMYAFSGLVYGIFSYLNLRIFIKEYERVKWDKYIFILALVFFTVCSLVGGINGFRFNTGGMVLFYTTYKFIIEKKTPWGIGIMVTPLIHYGFMLMVPILLLYWFIHPLLFNNKKVKPILLYIFIISWLLSWFLQKNAINLGFLTQSDALSGAVGSRISYVNSEDVANLVENRQSNSLFLSVQTYFNYAIKVYVFISILFLNNLFKRAKGNLTAYTNIFAFVLVFYSITFIATSFPSGGRFLNIAHLFMCVLLVKVYTIYNKNDMKKIILWSLPVFAFNIAFTNFLLPLLILTPTFWYGNLFVIIIEGLNFIIT